MSKKEKKKTQAQLLPLLTSIPSPDVIPKATSFVASIPLPQGMDKKVDQCRS